MGNIININSGFIPSDNNSGFENNNSGFIPEDQAPFGNKFTDIQELASQGAMAKVYKAKMHGKWIIIKRIKPEFKNNEHFNSKNIARARKFYEMMLMMDNDPYIYEQLKKCMEILNNADLSKCTAASKAEAYAGGLQAVKLNTSWGVIDNATKLPVTEFKYIRVFATEDGYELVKNMSDRSHSDLIRCENGQGVLVER